MHTYKAIMTTNDLFVIIKELSKELEIIKFRRIGKPETFIGHVLVTFKIKEGGDFGTILQIALTRDFEILYKEEKKDFFENIKKSSSDTFIIQGDENQPKVVLNLDKIYNFVL
ncbi:hypothetical protein [Mongoliitalea daihaiensis]|uniref:hypothetical protein n=1 Tax=Mongoliitalea daihaiensis TaxID=2782006 RepID=UPI001F33E46C|nr:hypothetical protein [Mongoliitalea daihaiensis]UJP64048.1 hypothetical protein IPZ59_14640 [Mongoliitalea daihaiensis]